MMQEFNLLLFTYDEYALKVRIIKKMLATFLLKQAIFTKYPSKKVAKSAFLLGYFYFISKILLLVYISSFRPDIHLIIAGSACEKN